jgi:protein HIRA/HIR1
MVIAEFPLWVVHSTDGTSSHPHAAASSSAQPSATTSASTSREERALGLLKTRKSAIYGLDCHPDGSRFATAGGDGTVRIWSTAPLFQNKHRGRLGKNGVYVSSGSSSSSSEEDETEQGEHGKNKSSNNCNSSEDSSDEPVHDLSNLVRRKKDGTAVPQSPAKPAAAAAAASLSSPKNHHNKPSNGNHNHSHRLLATLSAHTGSSVLAVRFSTTGTYLASAGDDACVCIYTQTNNATVATTGNLISSGNHHHEHWTRIHLCRGHALDVVDLVWSPDDSYLVSCSLDSETPIIVWNMSTTNSASTTANKSMIKNPYKILGKDIHTSTVKGVTFDPAGSYLASSGDDPAVCIWRAHDDWGLERRIDASSGIFRTWKEGDALGMSCQSLFRRISWSTDGAFICSTNSVVKNKHVASTISREGWSVSSANQASAGAANLVGHKQPVVVSRHAYQLLKVTKPRTNASGASADDESHGNSMDVDNDDDEEEDEPQHATLLALGDKRGFVTVWSTKKSRPVFKLQCSESRCTVTDLSWFKMPTTGDLALMVSLLDGQVVAIKFAVPDEIGRLLSKSEQSKVFQLRYGIDTDDDGRLFVERNTGSNLVENPLQMTLEDKYDDDDDGNNNHFPDDDQNKGGPVPLPSETIKARQKETNVQGKKRVQPILMSVSAAAPDKRVRIEDTREKEAQQKQKSQDPIQNALAAAEKASSTVSSSNAQKGKQGDTQTPVQVPKSPSEGHAKAVSSSVEHTVPAFTSTLSSVPAIPYSTERVHTAELPLLQASLFTDDSPVCYTVECKNSMRVPTGSIGAPVSCIDIIIKSGGKTTWKDQIVGTSCCAVAASPHFFVVGTCDGTVQLYSTSDTLGWACGFAFRSHPPMVVGHAPVSLRLRDADEGSAEMLVVTSDGGFAVYQLVPDLTLQYKGTVIPAMTHMALNVTGGSKTGLPKLSRIQMTESDHLLLLLSTEATAARASTGEAFSSRTNDSNVGGSLQAFVYNRSAELWMRVSDSRFILSDFYSYLPSRNRTGALSKWDDLVRMGSLNSQLKASHRSNADRSDGHGIYNQNEESSFIATRVHCEDRMACAVSLGSKSEFEYWLRMYVRILTRSGQSSMLRILIDMLKEDENKTVHSQGTTSCWWMSQAPTVLGSGRNSLVQSIVIPEMSKNRSLQRLTNEVNLEFSTEEGS